MATGTPLKVWFVNVGHGDCTIVKFPSGRVMMVDICNSKVLDEDTKAELLETEGWSATSVAVDRAMGWAGAESAVRRYADLLDDPIDVLKNNLPGQDIWRFILTHPDMDHMTGLHRLFSHEDDIGVTVFWDTDNSKGEPEKHGKGYDERDWEEYKRIRGREADPQAMQLYRDAWNHYWSDDSIYILSPTPSLKDECNENEDWNNLSYALRIVHGESSLILPADVEGRAQRAMVEHFGKKLKSTVLKAPHHGRASGYHEDFAEAVNPDYTIVSVGKKPSSDASNKYKKHTNKSVFSTRFQGTIYAELYPDGDIRMWNSPKKGSERIDDDAPETEVLAAAFRSLLGRGGTGLRI